MRLPFAGWLRTYGIATFRSDLVAAVIVTIMLIPQSLAYAMIAGMPPVSGLYASMLPLVAYAVFGSSRTLAVGPVALISLMTASAVGTVVAAGLADHATAAAVLAVMSGVALVAMGILRLGLLANFLSHPVIMGFVTGSSLLIAAGQLRVLFDVPAGGGTLPEILTALWDTADQINRWSLCTGVAALSALWLARRFLAECLMTCGVRKQTARLLARMSPIVVIALSAVAAWRLDFGAKGVSLVGTIPSGLPLPHLPAITPALVSALLVPSLLITVVGFIESVSMARTLAARRRERVDADQEFFGLGAANIAAGLSQGFPVTGGFARSVVNDDAGAETQMAGILTAIGIALAATMLTPLLAFVPQSTLGATIILAVLSLIEPHAITRVWSYSRVDFASLSATLATTLLIGLETAIVVGVILSLLLQIWRSSRPHIAVLGRVAGTEHFRNVLRHDVTTVPSILSLRVDESLHFANALYLESYMERAIADRTGLSHVVLMCSAINDIDASALESLGRIAVRLNEAGVRLHLSEVKGPVMDKLSRTDFPQMLGGIYLRHHEAVETLTPPIFPKLETRRSV